MIEPVTRMMELKKQQARAPKKQSPSAKQLLDQKLAIKEGLPLTADGLRPQAFQIADCRLQIRRSGKPWAEGGPAVARFDAVGKTRRANGLRPTAHG